MINHRWSNRYFLSHCVAPYGGEMFRFEIHDSSEEKTLRSYIAQYPNVTYYEYESTISADLKSLKAISNAKTEYVYLLGDGLTIDFNGLETLLRSIRVDQNQIIGLVSNTWMKSNKKLLKTSDGYYNRKIFYWNDYKRFFYYLFWHFTLFGASIINKNTCVDLNRAEKYIAIKSPFMNVCTMFDSLSANPGRCAVCVIDNMMGLNPSKPSSGWIKNKLAIDFFCCQYYKSLQLLPSEYNVNRDKVLKMHNKRTKLFRFRQIVKFRGDGNITAKILSQYKFYIRKTVEFHNRILMHLSILIPPVLIQKFYYFVKRKKLV